AFEMLEARYPHLSDLATRQHLSETELRLRKEIELVRLEGEQVRSELKETELKLTKEIEQVRLQVEQVRSELKETELKLTKEIEQVRLQVEQVRSELKGTELRLQKEIEQVRAELKVDIARTRAYLLQWTFVFWLTQFAAILAILWRVWPLATG
ncbi:MAG: hypothetical protein ACK4TK_05755, partial [Thiobacillaceae bacterium]